MNHYLSRLFHRERAQGYFHRGHRGRWNSRALVHRGNDFQSFLVETVGCYLSAGIFESLPVPIIPSGESQVCFHRGHRGRWNSRTLVHRGNDFQSFLVETVGCYLSAGIFESLPVPIIPSGESTGLFSQGTGERWT